MNQEELYLILIGLVLGAIVIYLIGSLILLRNNNPIVKPPVSPKDFFKK